LVVVCRDGLESNPKQWLAVIETQNRGIWLPAGGVEPTDENHYVTAACRETKEEAGIDVELKGVLRIETTPSRRHGAVRQRVIFYAEPVDRNQAPKSVPDKESMGAVWLTLEELKEMHSLPPPRGLRGPELYEWANYIENGGTIYPLDILASEETPVPTR
jgi:8-oxo-dGTP pyrophosphatase MutT (NUDIX family)